MKILFLTPSLPFPAHSGGKIKTFRMLQYLSLHHQITLVCLSPEDNGQFRRSLDDMKNALQGIEIFPFFGHKVRSGYNFFLSILKHIPLSVYRNQSLLLNEFVEQKVNDYDVLFIDHFIMAQYIPESFSKRVVIHQHNAEYLMWQRFAEIETNLVKKIILNYETHRIKNFERKLCLRGNAILVAPNDQIALQQLLPRSTLPFYRTMHLADDQLLDKFKDYAQNEKEVLYVGTLSWEANWDGLLWFLQGAWGEIVGAHPDVRLTIIGKASLYQETILKSFPNIEVLGFVDDLDVYFNRSLLFITPLRFGSGIKVKVVEAMYRGMAIVTTSIGSEGIGAKSSVHYFLADDLKSQVQKICYVLEHPLEAQEVGKKARDFSRTYLSWERVYQDLERSLG